MNKNENTGLGPRQNIKQATDANQGIKKIKTNTKKKFKKILLTTGVGALLLFCLFPVVWMVLVSFSQRPDFLGQPEYAFTLNNYRQIIQSPDLHFLTFLQNSFIVAGSSAVVCVLLASLAAYAISRFDFRGKILVVMLVLAFSMFPQISIVGYLYKIMTEVGLLNTYPALIMPYISWSLPLALWLLLSYFATLPRDFDEAAQVDGANRIQILTHIILPLSLPGLISTVLLVFMYSFNEFLFALMLTNDYRARTIPVGIALFQGLHGQIPWGQIMAASVIAALPVLLIALFLQRYIISGLTRGSVKG